MSVIVHTHQDDDAPDARGDVPAAALPMPFAFAVLTILLLCVYAPVVQADFLHRDDTVYLTLPRGWNMTPITLAQARPIMGFVIDCLNTSVVAGAGAKYVFPLLGLGLLATSLFSWLRRHGLHAFTAVPLSLAACCVPAFQETVPYLSVAVAIYAALASSLAVHAMFSSRSGNRLARYGLSFLLVFTALSAYQPSAMFGWALLVVPLYCTSHEDWPIFRRRLLGFSLLFGSTLAMYALAYKGLLHGMGMDLSGRSEAVPLEMLPAKLHWFLATYLPSTLRSLLAPLLAWRSPAASSTALGAALVAAVGLMASVAGRDVARSIPRFAERLPVLVMLLVMTYLPFVVLRENGGEAIYATGLQTALLVTLFLAVRESARTALRWIDAPEPWSRRAEHALAAVVWCCLATSASRTVLQEVVFPCHNRYRAIVKAVAADGLASTRRIFVVADEGFLGAYAEGLVRGVLNEIYPGVHPPPVAAAYRTAPAAVHIGREIAEQRYGEEFHAYYRYDPINLVYLLKAEELTPGQRAAADECFARFVSAAQRSPDTLLIDLSQANVAY